MPPAVSHVLPSQRIPGAKVILPQVVALNRLDGIAIVTVTQDVAVGVSEVNGAIPRINRQRPAQNPSGPVATLSIPVRRAQVLQLSGLQVKAQEIAGRPGETVKASAFCIHIHRDDSLA